MADPLETHLLRLGRAHHHLLTMGELLEEFIDENLDRFADEFQFDEGSWWYVGFSVNFPDPSPEFGLMMGEAMHEFRSTLDNLIWTLVKANKAKPSENCAFPICTSEFEWRQRVIFTQRGKDSDSPLDGLPDEAVEAVHDRQPYKRGEDAKRHPLARLRWLSNVDKHQVAHVMSFSNPNKTPTIYFRTAEGRRQLLREYRFSPGKSLHGEAKIEVFRVMLPRTFNRESDTEKVDVEEFPIDVAFSPRRYMLGDLRNIALEVTAIVLEFAQKFFPDSTIIPFLEEIRSEQDSLAVILPES